MMRRVISSCIIDPVGRMVRFSATQSDIEQMLRFLTRRMPGGVRLVPLQAAHRDELRWRRTIRPLISALRNRDSTMAWGLRPGAHEHADNPLPRLTVTRDKHHGTMRIDPDTSQLITLVLGPAEGAERRRDSLLLVRDWDMEAGDDPDAALIERADEARSLVERTARHLRRNAVRESGRWIVRAEDNTDATEAAAPTTAD